MVRSLQARPTILDPCLLMVAVKNKARVLLEGHLEAFVPKYSLAKSCPTRVN